VNCYLNYIKFNNLETNRSNFILDASKFSKNNYLFLTLINDGSIIVKIERVLPQDTP